MRTWQFIVGFIIALSVAFLLLGADEAKPQPTMKCGPLSKIAPYLRARYNELPVAGGLLSNGHKMIIVASPAGSWTSLIWMPGSTVCIISAGTLFWINDSRGKRKPKDERETENMHPQ